MAAGSLQAQMTEAEGIEFFESRIRPVLVRECYGCHSDQTGQAKGGLKLDTRQGVLLGGDSGPALAPGSLEDSPLWSAINYEDYAMPPSGQLSASVIEDFRVWIESGAADPRVATGQPEIHATVTDEDIRRAGQEFWAFQPPAMPVRPRPETADWSRGPIDDFVLEQLEARDLQPAGDADPCALLRRLSFDLIGLPPAPEQIDAFVTAWAEDAERAVAAVVDRWLASPRFGERWGRHWLDLARYAESSGKEVNATFPHAWRYRDYVIDSFNADKPYDRFIQEQIAGDLLPAGSDEQWAENLIATGFLAIGPKTLTERNPRQFRADLIDEQIDVSTRVVLGISVACARCHDHKFDPVPQSDYYALAGIFGSTDTWYGTLDSRQNRRSSDLILLPAGQPPSFEKPLGKAELNAVHRQLESAREEYQEVLQLQRQSRRSGTRPAGDVQQSIRQLGALSNRVAGLQSIVDYHDEQGNPKVFCMGVQPSERPRDANLLVRGEVDQPAREVPRGYVQVIGGPKPAIRNDSSGRLELARWMTDKSNPLTARVMANRIWQHLMGQGLVQTTENFGATGLPPTHPELLDYLAVRLMQNEWSIKTLIREIATSRAYRMSTDFDPHNYAEDPDNHWLWRASPRRLEAEAIRDAMLSVSGQLELQRPEASEVARAGATIVRNGQMRNIRQTATRLLNESMTSGEGDRNRRRAGRRARNRRGERATVASSDPRANCRSVYLPVVRDHLPRSLAVFDFAESSMVVGRRETSNTPDQGLYFLNNEMVVELSRGFARQLMEASPDPEYRIQRAFLTAWGRPPTQAERQSAREYLQELDHADGTETGSLQRLALLCQSIMAAAEFRVVD
jgi:hypothetical protein